MDDFTRALRTQKLNQSRNNLASARAYPTPDIVAKAVNVSPPGGHIEPNPQPMLEVADDNAMIENVAKNAPVSNNWFADAPENTALVKDEIPQLIDWERTIMRNLDSREGGNLARGWENTKLAFGSVIPAIGFDDATTDVRRTQQELNNLTIAMEVAASGQDIRPEMFDLPAGRAGRNDFNNLKRFLSSDPAVREQQLSSMVGEVRKSETASKEYMDILQGLARKRADVNYTATTDLRDIRNMEDLVEWGVVQGMPGIAIISAIVGAGLVSGGVGAAAGISGLGTAVGTGTGLTLGTGMAFGEIIGGQAENIGFDPTMYTSDMSLRAWKGALLSGSLEVVLGPTASVSALGARTLFNRVARKEALNNVSDEVLKRVSKGYLRRLGRPFLREGVEEFIAEGAQTMIEQASVDGRLELDSEALWAAFNGAALGGITGGTFGMGMGARAAIRTERVSKQLQDAGLTVRSMEELAATTSQLKLPQRSGRKFRELTKKLGLDQTHVFFQAADIQAEAEKTGRSVEEMVAALGGTMEDFDLALRDEGRIAVKASGVLGELAGANADFVKQSGSITPTGYTPKEAEQFEARRQEIEDQVALQNDLEGMAPERRTIFEQISRELKSTSRMTDTEVETNATLATAFFETMGSRYGESATAMYERFGFTVTSEAGMAKAQQELQAARGAEIAQESGLIRDAKATLSELRTQLEGLPEGSPERTVADSAMIEAERVISEASARIEDLQSMGDVADGGGATYNAGSNFQVLYQPENRRAPATEGSVTGVPLVNTLASAAKLALDKKFPKGRDFKVALQKLALKRGPDITGLDETAEAAIADYIFEDALEAVQDNRNAIGWYDRAVTEAKAVLSELYPEIAEGGEAEFAFIWALAVTSNGLKVDKNFELAADAYEAWKANGGVFPTNIGIGQAKAAINSSLALYSTLVEQMGSWEAARDFMISQQTVNDIEAATGMAISGEGRNEMIRGAGILGPKIGNGFFSNLYGYFDGLTMDRWLMRSVGRWRGTLIATNEDMETQKRADIRAIFSDNGSNANAVLYGHLFDGLSGPKQQIMTAAFADFNGDMTDAQVNTLAELVTIASAKPAWRTVVNDMPNGADLRKLGNALGKYLDGQVEAPAGANERAFLRRAFQSALVRLQQQPGMEQLTMADLQALLWYPEKLLYESAKKKAGEEIKSYADDEAPDYGNAARKLVADRLGRARGGRADQRPAGGSGQTDQQGGQGQKLNQGGITSDYTETVRRAPTGRENIRGRLVESLGVFGSTERPVVELSDPADFRAAIEQTKQELGELGAQVTLYDDYAGKRVFIMDDGLSGFALDGDDIISVFGHPDAPAGAVKEMFPVATALGGRRLDAFNTFLPMVYERAGFRAVARLAFSREYAPDGWDYDYYQREFNSSDPDIMFMVYDPANANRDTDNVVDEYDAGMAAQAAAITEAGQTLNQSAVSVFPNTTVTQTVYHSTQADQQFGEFSFDDPDELGVHFGSPEAAENRVEIKQREADMFGSGRENLGEARTGAFNINITNPLRMPESRTGGWKANDVMIAIRNGIENEFDYPTIPIDLTEAEIEGFYDGDVQLPANSPKRRTAGITWEDAEVDLDGGRAEWMRLFLQAKGFDGIVYDNQFEGGGDSYIVFDNSQIQFANPDQSLLQTAEGGPRGQIFFPGGSVLKGRPIITLFQSSDRSTFAHEAGHFFLQAFTELAATPNAPSDMQADLRVINTFLGRDEASLSTDFTVDEQEKWARSFEKYVETGKAPSVALRRSFERLRKWLVNVYRQFGGLQEELSPEIIEVMDRMLATDDAIAIAKAEQDAAPMLMQRPPDMPEKAWQAYKKLSVEHDDEAHATLLEKTMAAIRAKRSKGYKDRRDVLRAEISASIAAEPVYQTLAKLRSKDRQRLNRAALVEEFGEGVLADLDKHAGKRKIEGPDGENPDLVAQTLGYKNAAVLVDELQQTDPIETRIETELRQRLRQEFADVLDDGSIKEEAMAALHGDKNRQMMHADLQFIADMLGEDAPTMRSIAEIRADTIDAFAEISVRQSLQEASYLREERSAAGQAQRLIGRIAERAAGAKLRNAAREDLLKAYAAKERQIAAHYKYTEARKMKKDVTRLRKKAGMINRKDAGKRIAEPHITALREVLEKYDFRASAPSLRQRMLGLANYVRAMKEDGRQDQLRIDLEGRIATGGPVHYSDLTVDEFRELANIVDNIEHIGRSTKKVLDGIKKVEFVLAKDSVIGSLETNFKDADVNLAPTEEGAGTKGGKMARGALLLMTNIDGILSVLDKSKADGLGVLNNLINVPVQDAMSRAMSRRRQNADFIGKELWFSVYGKDYHKAIKRIKGMQVQVQMRDGKATLDGMMLLALAGNTGTATNMERLTNVSDAPNGMTKEEVERVLSNMDDDMWKIVTGVWSKLGETWPEIVKLEIDSTGIKPEKVDEAIQVSNAPAFAKGGGYWPIKYDPRLSPGKVTNEQMNQMLENAMTGNAASARTKNGFTKSRTSSTGLPILLDFGLLQSHMNDVAYDLEMRTPLASAMRIIADKEVSETFARKGLRQEWDQIKMWIEDVANGDRWANDSVSAAMRHLREGASIAAMGFSVTTLIQQPLGLFNAANIIGSMNLLKGTMAYMNDPLSNSEWVKSQSPFMEERVQTMQRDIAAATGAMRETGPGSQFAQVRENVAAASFFLMQKVQYFGVDMPTWMASYGKARREGMTEQQGITYADRMVARSQGSGTLSDRTALERGSVSDGTRQSEMARSFTTFMTFVLARLSVTQARYRNLNFNDPQTVMDVVSDIVLAYVLPSIATSLVLLQPWDEREQEEIEEMGIPLWWLKNSLGKRELLGLPIVSQVQSAWEGYGAESAFGGGLSAIGKGGKGVYDLILDDDLTRAGRVRATRDITSGVGILFKMPTIQLNRIIKIGFGDDELGSAELTTLEMMFGKQLTFED